MDLWGSFYNCLLATSRKYSDYMLILARDKINPMRSLLQKRGKNAIQPPMLQDD